MLPEYFRWHYKHALSRLSLTYRNLLIFTLYYFGISFHLRTLFSPWRRQIAVNTSPGLHLAEILGTASFNMISRVLGAIIRSIVVISGLVLFLIMGATGGAVLLVFAATPLLWLPLFLISRRKNISPAENLIRISRQNLKRLLLKTAQTEEGGFILDRLGITVKKLLFYMDNIYDTGDFRKFQSVWSELKNKPKNITDIFTALVQTYTPFSRLVLGSGIEIRDIEAVGLWYDNLYKNAHTYTLSDLNSLLRIPGIGQTWIYGFTPLLDKYVRDLGTATDIFPQVIGRNQEIASLERILSKTEQNSLIFIGEPGIGRHAIISELAKRIATGWVLPALCNKRVLLLDIKNIAAQTPDPISAKDKISQILSEAQEAGNVILVIDHMDNFVSEGEGKLNLTDVLTDKLPSGKLQIIGVTDPASYHQYIFPNNSLKPLFDKLDILQPDEKIVLSELELSIVPVLEQKHNALITYQSLLETIKDSARFESDKPFPEKAIDLLDEVLVYLNSAKQEKILLPHHIQEFLSLKTKIPIGDLEQNEKEKLVRLEALIHKSVINQEYAVKAIADALRRARSGLSSENKPLGSFLFMGPTGVGKTETAKALARIYYGSEKSILRLDMSQYQTGEGLERLIGSLKTGSPGELTRAIRDNPFSLLLLDEFEKADSKIYNLFLTLLDEGYIEDAGGRKIDGSNLMIIATSNAGSEYIRENVSLGIKGDDLKLKLLDYVQKEKIFSPEFLNRFDSLVVFIPLSEGNMREVAKLMLNQLNARLVKQNISVDITPDLIRKLSAAGFDPVFGARAMRRIIQEKIENQVAQMIISGEVKKGDKIQITI